MEYWGSGSTQYSITRSLHYSVRTEGTRGLHPASDYVESRLPSPLPTKDGGNLYAVKDVRAYVLGLAHSRSGHLYWQRAHQLLLDQADVVTLRRQVELALFCDAQLDLETMDTA